MILTYLWSWSKVKVIKPGMKWLLDPEQDYNHSKFWKTYLKQCPQTANINFFLSNQKTHQLSPLNICKNEN